MVFWLEVMMLLMLVVWVVSVCLIIMFIGVWLMFMLCRLFWFIEVSMVIVSRCMLLLLVVV